MSDLQGTLFEDDPELLHGEPVVVIAVCHRCGARSEPIPLTESGDPGDPWTGVNVWGFLALAGHRDECPARDG